MADAVNEFYQTVFDSLAQAIPMLLDEYACTFPDFQARDVTWYEKPDPLDPQTILSAMLWRGNVILQMSVQTQLLNCRCVANYPNKRH